MMVDKCGSLRKQRVLMGLNGTVKKPCTASTRSVRFNYIFEGSRISFGKIIRFMYKYIRRTSFLDIAHDLKIDRKTASSYGFFCRDRIIEDVTCNRQMLGGRDEFGIPRVVDIDESRYFRARYNRGYHTIGQWYLGGVTRGSKKPFSFL
jgi:hypothetical protein